MCAGLAAHCGLPHVAVVIGCPQLTQFCWLIWFTSSQSAMSSGSPQPGHGLPGQQEFPGVARTTIRRAIKRLREDGLVETRPGRGTFVLAPDDGGEQDED